MRRVYCKKTKMPVDARSIYDWHMRDGAFERLVPPFEKVSLKNKDFELKDGSRALLSVKNGPLELSWLAEHSEFQEGSKFVDKQVKGPFSYWKHSHEFVDNPDGSYLKDKIEYELPLGAATNVILGPLVEKKLDSVFEYRHSVTTRDLEMIANRKERRTMKVLVTGSTGLIGQSLVPLLKTQGHEVDHLRRSHVSGGPVWTPSEGKLNHKHLEGYDAIINLSGENIASGRWTEDKKKKLRDSRINSTRLLVEAISKLEQPPEVLLCASAIGYYGDSGDEEVVETNSSGDGFLAKLCQDWEDEALQATVHGTRVVNLRFGVVLSPNGGMMEKLLPPFLMGAGGRIGSGQQYMSWVSIDDAVGAIAHCLTCSAVKGPVNVVAPQPCTNDEFTRTLGKVLVRPTLFPVPEFAANLAFGQMAEETMLASCRVTPDVLSTTGYKHRHRDLESALRHLLGKPEKVSA